jgi:predicted ATPase
MVRLLGPVTAERDGESLIVTGSKPRLVLALLAAREGAQTSAELLIDGLWGEDPPPTARKSLQVHISTLRKTLGREAIVSTDGGYRLVADTDAARFEALVDDAARLVDVEPATALRHAEQALTLWRGEPFADLGAEASLRAERARLDELLARATTTRVRALLELGRNDEAIAELELPVASFPYREELRSLQMLALYRSGRQAEALRAFQDARLTLGEELGIEPSAELRDLEQAILVQDPLLQFEARPIGVPSTLPHPPTAPLIGRSSDIERLVDLLGRSRLVSIVGVGGAGKTSLAIETATRAMTTHPGGAYFVDFTAIDKDGDVLGAIMDGVGLSVVGIEPTASRLVEFLRPRRCLLLMDNCEHVLNGVSALVAELLQRCPDLTVLATSRETMSTPGEHVYRIPLLDFESSGSPAVELFLRRAKESDAGFEIGDGDEELIRVICATLDGIPLAIELAATQVGWMSLAEIRDGMADRFTLLSGPSRDPVTHHQTLRAAIEWSHGLLEEGERMMLRRLAVFQGGFDLGDVAAVSDIAEPTASASVRSLTSKSLVSVTRDDTGVRRRMLETIRAFAEEKLADAGELEDTMKRHYERFIGSMRGTSYNYNNHYSPALSRNMRELSNIVAALEWGVGNGLHEESALTVARVFWPLVDRGVAHKFQALLDKDYDVGDEDRALLLTGRMMKAYSVADPDQVPPIADAARELDPENHLDDIFVPQILAYGFAPVEGAEERLAYLERLLPSAERSSTPDANVGMIEMQRAGQLYSLARLEEALEAAQRASRLRLGRPEYWDEVLAELALLMVLDRRVEAEDRLARVEHTDDYESGLARALVAVGSSETRRAAKALAVSARRHVSGRLYLQEGDYLCLFAAFRSDIGDRERAVSLLDDIGLRFGVIQWLVWPHVGNWTSENFIAENTAARHRELGRMRDTEWDGSAMARLLEEEIEFWGR